MRSPSATDLGRGLLAVGIGLAIACADAATPVTSPDRRLAVEEAGVAARARLFELSRIAVPLCGEKVRWSLGALPVRVLAQEPAVEQARQFRQLVMKEFAAEPGDYVFTTTPAGMPFGLAGVRRGDRIVAADTRRWHVYTELPASASASERRPYLELVKELSDGFAADPVREFVLRRGAEQAAISVRAVPACPVLLSAVDSQHEYAEVDGNSVLATLPLLATLDDAQLTMVLANELSHILLGHGRTAGGDVAIRALFGSLFDVAQNREMERLPLADADLVQADHLTLWLLKAYAIRPRAWLEFLEQMEARSSPLQAASYARTRPLTRRRAEELRAEVALFESSGRLKLPKGISAETLRDVATAAVQVRRAATVAKSREPQVHAWQVPAGSGFAAIDEVDRVPIRAEGKDRYRHYLTLPSPKAFFVMARGGWRFYSDTPDAMGIGLDYCAREGYTCWLYAVDDQVVWQEDPGRRISTKAALQPRP